MKIYYHPSYNGRVYIDYSSEKHPGGMLFDEVCVSTADLLDQLLLRAGIPQGVAEGSEKRTKAREEAYQQAIDADWINGAKDVDPEGTVQQVLHWRDTLIMAGWTEEMTASAQSRKLRALSEWESRYDRLSHLARADKWRALRDYIKEKGSPLHSDDTIEVMTPKVLLPNLVVEVLEMLGAEWKMEQLDESLNSPEGIQVVHITEQYEGWQQVYNYAKADMIVCSDSVRLNDSMRGIGGAEWQTDNAGCPNVVDSLTDMLDAPESLVWLDCAGNTSAKYLYDFLTSAEIAELASVGVVLPTAEEMSSATLREQFTLLNRIAEITLIAPERHEGEMLGEHPIVTCIGRKKEEQAQPTALPQTNEEPVRTFEAKAEYHLDASLIKQLDKGNVSPSFLDKLLQTPFDFLVEKMAKLPAPEDNEDDNIEIAKGHVAHKLVEDLVSSTHGNLEKMEQGIKEDYQRYFEGAMAAKDRNGKVLGEVLTDEENRNELATFQMDLQESVLALIGIIRVLHLTPDTCEYDFEFEDGIDEFIPAKGSIDMVLLNEVGHYVIFDFKYSKSDFYPKKLKYNHSTQLEFYRKALEKEGKTVAWTAYYLFPSQTLYTKADLTDTDGVDRVEDPGPRDKTPKLDDLWSAMRKGYAARVAQLEQGIVEEAEGMDVYSLDYSKVEGVYPVEKAYKAKNNEKGGGFCRYKTKDTNLLHKPTHHTILKDHLK